MTNKIWVNKGNEFYFRSMKTWLQENDIEIYLKRNKGRFVIVKRSIKR